MPVVLIPTPRKYKKLSLPQLCCYIHGYANKKSFGIAYTRVLQKVLCKTGIKISLFFKKLSYLGRGWEVSSVSLINFFSF